MAKDYRKAFHEAKAKGDEEMEKMVEQSVEKYAALGIDFLEETSIHQFISNIFAVSEEDAIEVYELVSAILTATPALYKDAKSYETAMRAKLNKLSPAKAALFGAVLSLQMKAEMRMRQAMAANVEPEEPQEPPKEAKPAAKKVPAKRKPKQAEVEKVAAAAPKKEDKKDDKKGKKDKKVTLDEDGDPEGAEPIYVPNYSEPIPGYW